MQQTLSGRSILSTPNHQGRMIFAHGSEAEAPSGSYQATQTCAYPYMNLIHAFITSYEYSSLCKPHTP